MKTVCFFFPSLYADSIDEFFSFTKNKGVHVFIHNKSETPTFFEGFDVSVDTMTDVMVRRTFIDRLPAPYSDCSDNIANYGSVFTKMFTEKGLTYRQSHCYEYCFQRKLTDLCGCK